MTLGLWQCHFKVRFVGSYWKIYLLLNLAKVLRLHTDYYAAGTGRGE